MGNSSSLSIPNYTAKIDTKDEKKFTIEYHSLVEHILLLRKVIDHPEMTTEGSVLDHFIKDYCKRMDQGEMKTAQQQSKLPWQIEWIWHVHRLHPLAYLNDCSKQFSDGPVDKKARKLITKYKKPNRIMMTCTSSNKRSSFIPSVDLTKAVIRQKDFLDKFQKHYLYTFDFEQPNQTNFLCLVQNYVSFIKLAQKKQMIVPTFDIDLIWHTHMRYPLDYHEFSVALCGFILDHDDSIESNVLTDAYQITADRWKETYQSEYGQNLDQKQLQRSRYISSCAMVVVPFVAPTTNNYLYAGVVGCSGAATNCASGGNACGGFTSTSCDGGGIEDADTGCDNGGCGGSGGDSGGGCGGGGGDSGGGCGGCGGD